MQNSNKNFDPGRSTDRFLKGMARRPFVPFLLLSIAAAAAAALIFFSFQAPVFFESGSGPAGGQTGLFDEAKAKKYREVFSAMEQRQADYLQATKASYPDLFWQPSVASPATTTAAQ